MATRRRASRNSITGTITDLQRRVRHLQTLPAPSRLANEVVRRVNIQPRAVDSDQIALRAVVNDSVEDAAIKERNMDTDSVNNSAIQDNAITRLKILDGEVVDGKLGGNSVNRDNVKDSAINANKLANASVEENKIVNGAVTNSKIGSGAVRTANIQSSAVTTGTIANLNVTSDKIATGAVTGDKIATGAVTRAKLGSGSVGTTQIEDGAVTAVKINESQRGVIIRSGVLVGLGLTTTFLTAGLRLAPDFGTGSNQVARGNHNHTGFTQTAANQDRVTILGSSVSRSSHFHTLTVSSQRYKKNISNYVVQDPKKILELQLKQYKYKNSAKDIHKIHNKEWLHGYIVEEVENLGLTEVVAYDKEGRPDALDYAGLSLLMVELLKEHQKEIDILKSEIKNLRDNND